MNGTFKNLFKQFSVYGFFNILGKSVGLLLLPVYTRYLEPQQYGVLELVEVTASIFAMFASAGLGFSVFKFYHKYESQDDKSKVVSSAILLSLIIHSMLACLGLIFVRRLSTIVFESPEQYSLLVLVLIRIVLDGTVSIGLDYIRVVNRARLFGILSILRLLCAVGLNILFVVFYNMGIQGILLGSLISQIIVGFPLIIYLFRELGVHFDTKKLLPMLRYSLPFIGVLIGQLVINYADRFLLQRYTTLTEVGIYSLGYKFGFLVNFFVLTPFLLMWEGKVFQIEIQRDAREVYSRSLTYLSAALIFVALVLTLFIREILIVTTTPAYYSAGSVVPLIALAYIFNGLQTFFRLGMLLKSRTSIIGVSVMIQSIISVGLYFLAIKEWGILGAAVATIISFFGLFCTNFIYSQRLYPIRVEIARILKIIVAALGVLAIAFFLPEINILASIFIKIGLVILFVVFLAAMGFLNWQEKQLVRNTFLGTRRRLHRMSELG